MIFISYRVADSAQLVGRLRADLVRLYASTRIVYRDKSDLQGGQDWPDELSRALIECPILLAVIGPGWADARFATGPQAGELRLSDPKDWVRTEIRTALDLAKSDSGRHVIPIFVNATPMKEKEWLERRGLTDLFDKQGLPLRDDPDYDHDLRQLLDRLEALRPELKTIREGVPKPPPPPRPPPPPELPPRPPVCAGRADLLSKLEAHFLPPQLKDPLPRLALAGIGGIGKSTTILWFLHDPRVKKRYGHNRHFVSLDGADSRGAVVGKLAETLGIPTGPGTEGHVLETLATGRRRLVVLDNAETPLESGDRLKVQDLLGTLAKFAHVGLIATLRPTVPLTGWDTTDELTRLLAPADREAFDFYSGRKFATDPHVAGFVESLEGWPIVLRLAAEQAKNYRTIHDFQSVWDRERDELLRQGTDRASNFAVSVKLSLESPQMTPVGRRLLAVLARLPNGVRHDDLTKVFGEDGIKAGAAVRKVGGLVIENEDRMRMLAPLREHLKIALPFQGEDRERVVKFYCAIAAGRRNARSCEWEAIHAQLAPETENVRAMILFGLELGDRLPAYLASQGLGEYGRFAGLDFSQQLRCTALVACDYHDLHVEADCVQRLGHIALTRSNYAEAGHRYEEALMLFRYAEDRLGEASCTLGLGDIALRQSNHAEASRHYEDALLLYHRVGSERNEGFLIQRLGDIALRRSNHSEAARRYVEALTLYRRVGSVRGEAYCIQGLAEIVLRRSDHAEAGRHYEQAFLLYRLVGSVRGQANCCKRLGEIALNQSDYTGAGRHYAQALPLYRQVGWVRGEANILKGLGDIALRQNDYGKASRHYEEALPLYRRASWVRGEANILKGLGDIAHAQMKIETARQRWDEALTLYQRIAELFPLGETCRRLARIATDPAERQRFIAAARAAWTSIDRPDLIAQLDREFPPDTAST